MRNRARSRASPCRRTLSAGTAPTARRRSRQQRRRRSRRFRVARRLTGAAGRDRTRRSDQLGGPLPRRRWRPRISMATAGSNWSAAPTAARVSRASRGRRAYRWQAIRPRATTATGDQRINSFGIGGEIEVRTGLHAQKQVIAAPGRPLRPRRGGRAEVARITWPNGVLQSEFDLAADVAIAASQRLKGSCPWLFAWNGTRDGLRDRLHLALAARPAHQRAGDGGRADDRGLGQAFAATSCAPGTASTTCASPPSCGKRTSSISCPCWSSTIPKGRRCSWTSGSPCRRRASAAIATVTGAEPSRRRATIRGATSLDIVRARDDRASRLRRTRRLSGRHPRPLRRARAAGRRAAHRTAVAGRARAGSIRPTARSTSRSARARHAAPTGLSLQVADAARPLQARCAPGWAFPPGKDKTILHRPRPASSRAPGRAGCGCDTNLEIFWDRLGWAVGRPDVKLEPRRLDAEDGGSAVSAATRSPSRRTPARPSGRATCSSGIAARAGAISRASTRASATCANCSTTVDDRYVIMNAGDELRLRFRKRLPPPPGWCATSSSSATAGSRTATTTPSPREPCCRCRRHRSPHYAAGTGRLEDDPVYRQHREDFERYHTRYVSPAGVRDALRRSRSPGPDETATPGAHRRWPLCVRRLLATPASDPPLRRPARRPPPRRPAVGSARYGFHLTEVASAAGLDFVHEAPTLDPKLAHIMPQVASMGAASRVVDFDADGRPDLYVTNSEEGLEEPPLSQPRRRHLRGRRRAPRRRRSQPAPTPASRWASVFGDYDNDGFEDLFLYQLGPARAVPQRRRTRLHAASPTAPVCRRGATSTPRSGSTTTATAGSISSSAATTPSA